MALSSVGAVNLEGDAVAARTAVRPGAGPAVWNACHEAAVGVVPSVVPAPAAGSTVVGDVLAFVRGTALESRTVCTVATAAVGVDAVVHVPIGAVVGGAVVHVGSGVGISDTVRVGVAVGVPVGVAVGVGVGVLVAVTFGVDVAVAVAVETAVGIVPDSVSGAVVFAGRIEASRDGSTGETNPTVKSTAQATMPAARRPLSMP